MWDYGGVDGKKYRSVMRGSVVGRGTGCGGGQGGGVCCLLEVPEGCNCQVNTLQCTLKGVKVVGGGKCIRWKSVPLCYCSGKVDICLNFCGWLDLVWLCPGLRYWLGSMSRRLFVILYMVESLASALLRSRRG